MAAIDFGQDSGYLSTDPMAGISQGGGVSAPPGGVTPGSGIVGPQSGGAAPQITNPHDPAQARAWFQWQASQQGADPYLSQPGGVDYYTKAWQDTGDAFAPSYWGPKSTLAQFGGAVGAGGGGTLGGLGSLINHVPSAADAANTPGYQFMQQEAMNGVLGSKAAQGLLQSGSTLKDLQNRAAGLAGTNYFNLANLGLQTNQANVGNLFNLANLGLTGSSVGSQ